LSTMTLHQFQEQVSDLLLRHRSLLDVLSKFQQSNAAANRAVTKSITECGCIAVNAGKQEYAPDMSLDEAKLQLETHVEGRLCEHCREIVGNELGKNLFYMASLCNLLEVDLEQIVENESKKCSTLGLFNLS